MRLEVFHKVPAGATETLFNEQNYPLFKSVDLVKYLGITNIRDNFKDFPLHHAHPKSEIEGAGLYGTLGREKNPHHIFINLDSAIEIAVGSCLRKMAHQKGVEKIQKEHQEAITDRDNQLHALEFTNEEHQQEILRLNEEINDPIGNRHVARRGFLATFCVSSKRTVEKFTHTTLFDVSIGSLKNISDGLNFVTQIWEVADQCDDPNAIN